MQPPPTLIRLRSAEPSRRPRLATTLAAADVPAGTRPGSGVSTGSEHGRGGIHEWNLDADQGNHRRPDSLAVERHEAARSRDQVPPEESRPEAERQVVEVAAPSADVEERRDTLRRVRVEASESAGCSPEYIQSPRRPEGLEDVPCEERNGRRESGAPAQIEPETPAHLGAGDVFGVEIGARVEVGPQDESQMLPEAIGRCVEPGRHQHRARSLKVVFVSGRKPEAQADSQKQRSPREKLVLGAQDQIADAGGVVA